LRGYFPGELKGSNIGVINRFWVRTPAVSGGVKNIGRGGGVLKHEIIERAGRYYTLV